MGRKPTITRETLLDAAEAIVRAEGPQGLTIDQLAKAAGISKGGVQYSFASKDALVKALVDRWTDRFDQMLEPDRAASPAEFVSRYIAALRSSQNAMDAKMAGLMIAYIQNPENLSQTRAWYRSIFDRLAGDAPEAEAARVTFLAVEGLFLMQIIGLSEDGIPSSLLDDVERVLSRLLDRPL
ncbi:TetR/AcrR family transcriptional regulator [Aureimonas sp. AU40]|uniref:TetR/AcrR family transcriptional regulator n=1 Tax=Aureimonas sp. AU40 TaxID=1637747 RepID=UPI0007823B82|nr:TetR/AcrR family transcriptional regulator [Aureimonas sp. AU40]